MHTVNIREIFRFLENFCKHFSFRKNFTKISQQFSRNEFLWNFSKISSIFAFERKLINALSLQP
jgi:hypothetical protein